MIDREHPLSLTRQAKLLEISRGAVYYQPRPISEADLALMRLIVTFHHIQAKRFSAHRSHLVFGINEPKRFRHI